MGLAFYGGFRVAASMRPPAKQAENEGAMARIKASDMLQ